MGGHRRSALSPAPGHGAMLVGNNGPLQSPAGGTAGGRRNAGGPDGRLRRGLRVHGEGVHKGRVCGTAGGALPSGTPQFPTSRHCPGAGGLRRGGGLSDQHAARRPHLPGPRTPRRPRPAHLRHCRLHARRGCPLAPALAKGRPCGGEALAHARLAQGGGRPGAPCSGNTHRGHRQRVQGAALGDAGNPPRRTPADLRQRRPGNGAARRWRRANL